MTTECATVATTSVAHFWERALARHSACCATPDANLHPHGASGANG